MKFHASHNYPNVLVVVETKQAEVVWNTIVAESTDSANNGYFSFRPFVYLKENLNDDILNQMYSHEFGVLLSVSTSSEEKGEVVFSEINAYLPPRLCKKWMHVGENELAQWSFQELSNRIHSVFLTFVRQRLRPAISVFSTAFHSFHKIQRVFRTMQQQTLRDWEWIIVDDSKDDENFEFLRKEISMKDHRITVLRRDFHSGCIGLVKNQAASLCHAPYVVEVDHDDELLPDCLEEITLAFQKFPDVGFVYMTFAECHERDRRPHQYPSPWALGYGYYRSETHEGVEYKVGSTPNINDLTVSNIVGMPNHPRAWRKSTLMEVIENYSEYLPVADDYEVLYRTFLLTPMLHIDKFAYIQFRNDGGNNFTFIRNREITKFQSRVSIMYNDVYQANERFSLIGVNQRPRFYPSVGSMEKDPLKVEEFVNYLVTGSVKQLSTSAVAEARRIRQEALEGMLKVKAEEVSEHSELLTSSQKRQLLLPVGGESTSNPPNPSASTVIPGLPFPCLGPKLPLRLK